MKTRKLLALLLAAVMIAGLFFGCTKTTPPETTPAPATATPAPAATATPAPANEPEATPEPEPEPEGPVYPMLTTEPVTLSWFYPLGSTSLGWIKDWSESPTIQELQRRTNVTFEWYNPYVDFREEKYNLMLAGDEMTDLITHRFLGMTGYVTGDRAINDGNYLRLNELIDSFMPNYKALLDNDYDAYAETVTGSGNIWAVYLYNDPNGYGVLYPSGLMYRKDIADACGLTESPVTLDQWEQFFDVLIQNGHEHPFMIGEGGLSNSEVINGAYDVDHSFFQIDGVVKYGPAENGYRDYVTRMNEWVNKGYAYRDFATTDAWDSMSSGNTVVSWMNGYFVGDTAAAWMGPDFFIEPCPDAKLYEGQKIHLHAVEAKMSDPTAITTACGDLEIACRLIDYLYSEEGTILCNWGAEGITYEMKNGQPEFTDFMLHYTDTSLLDETMEAFTFTVATRDLVLENKYSDKYAWASGIIFQDTDNAYELPVAMNMTAEESNEYATIMSDIQTYVQENIVAFIVGTKPISEWDSYVETMRSIKLDRATQIVQAAYDRYVAAKG